jgi:hypothetical protein
MRAACQGGPVRAERRRWAAAAGAVAAVAGLVAVPASVAAARSPASRIGAGPGPEAPAPAAEPQVERVVVVGVPGLRWDDVDPATTRHIARAAQAGSVGSLSVRSAPEVTCPSDGWLSLGAGGYAAAHDPDVVDPRLGCGGRPVPVPQPAGPASATVPEVASLNDRMRFDARPGWLAEQVSCVSAAGRGAGLAAADAGGRIGRYRPDVPRSAAAMAELVAACPATVVDGGTLPEGPGRAEALARADEIVGNVRAGVPERTAVLVLGVAETTADRARLHVAVAEGPGFPAGWLSSTSTRRSPYVQLADVAPTVAGLVGPPPPDDVAGRPLLGGQPGRPRALADTRQVLVDRDARAVGHRAVVAPFFAGLAVVVVATSGALMAVLIRWRRSGASAGSRRTVDALRSATLALAGVPAATFLANLVPWWRAPLPLVAVVAATTGAAALVWAAAVAAGRRATGAARARAQVVTVAAVSLAVVVVDVVTGARLQIDSLLGYNPLVAGRFAGLGNIAFAVLGSAGVVVSAQAVRSRSAPRGVAAVAGVGGALVAIDGWPGWGADVGGVLTLVPTYVVLGVLVAGRRLRAARVAAAAMAGVAAAAAIGWIDFLRPAERRSHFGRFVGTALDGGALGTIERKAAASLDLLLLGPHTLAAAALTVLLALVLVRPPPLLRAASRVHPCLHPMRLATAVLAGVGLAVNDSIVAVAMVVALVVGPLVLVLCASIVPAEQRLTGAPAPSP